MSEWPLRLQVARWEFQRFVKPNQLVFSFILMLVMGGLGYGAAKMAARPDSRKNTIAVVGGQTLGMDRAQMVGNLSFTPAITSQLDSLRGQVTAGNLDGILILDNSDSAHLVVKRYPTWKSALEAQLTGARQRLELSKAGLTSDRLAAMLAPVELVMEFQSGNDGRAARIVAMIAVGLVLYGVFTSMAYMLVSVTAEKQLRVTEQVISAISPQTWIDGKIIGISAVALVNVVIFAAGAAVWLLGRSIASGSQFSMGAAEPRVLLWILLFAVLGFVFWLSVFGAVAATIDDPNTSTRGPLMFLPAFFSVAGFAVAMNPYSSFARVAGMIPLTSPAVMPARIALTEVPLPQLLVSAALLVIGAALARRAGGKIFAVAMLMYGKEPTWREMKRWVRETS